MVTGGHDYSSIYPSISVLKKVTSYTRTGEADLLPELNVARYGHACGSYLTDQGDMVRFVSKYQ